MRHRIVAGLLVGLLAGAAGTTALNTVSYSDMLMRGRRSSTLPEQLVDRLAGLVGLKLSDDETAAHRRQALAALLGIGVGLGVGAAYGLAGGARGPGRVAAGAVVLTVAASLASDAPLTAAGLTDPRTWPADAWLSDLVPHLAYGIVTAVTYDRLNRRRHREVP